MPISAPASKVDTFAYKPELKRLAGQQLPLVTGVSGEIEDFLNSPHRLVPSPWKFKRCGESGIMFPRVSRI